MKILLSIILVFSVIRAPMAHAQPKTYFKTPRLFSPTTVSVDGSPYKLSGFPSNSFVNSFASNPQSLDFAQKYRSNQVWASSIFMGGSLGGLGYVLYKISENEGIDLGSWLFGYFVVLMVGGVLQFKAKQRLIQAMNTYNGIDEAKTTQRHKFELAPATRGLGLALKF